MKKILGKLLLSRIKRSFLDERTPLHHYLLSITNTTVDNGYTWTMETGYTGILSMEYKQGEATHVVQLGIYDVLKATRHKSTQNTPVVKHKYFFVLSKQEYEEIKEAFQRIKEDHNVTCMSGIVNNTGASLTFYKITPVIYHDTIKPDPYYILSTK